MKRLYGFAIAPFISTLALGASPHFIAQAQVGGNINLQSTGGNITLLQPNSGTVILQSGGSSTPIPTSAGTITISAPTLILQSGGIPSSTPTPGGTISIQGGGSLTLTSTLASFPSLNGFGASQQLNNFFERGNERLEDQLTRGTLFLPTGLDRVLDVGPDVPLQEEDLEKLESSPSIESSSQDFPHSPQSLSDINSI